MELLSEALSGENLQDVSKRPIEMMLVDAAKIDTPQSIRLPEYKLSPLEGFVTGAIKGVQSLEDTFPAIEIYWNKAGLAFGGYFGASPQTVERKRLNLLTASRNLQAAQRERYQYLNESVTNQLSYGLGQGAVNYGTMLIGGFGVGTASRALGLSTARAAAAETAAGLVANAALENVEQQSDRLPLNEAGEIDESKMTPEWARNQTIGTTAYLATSALLEKYVGFGKQVKMWETPINFANKQLKNMSPVLISAGKNALSEGLTEGLQSLASSGILFAEGTIKMSDMPDRLQQAWKEAIIGCILGGSVGTAVAINQQHNVKTMLNDEIGKVIQDPDEREAIVEAIYDSGTTEMTNLISKELELSSELNTKHGAIYENMSAAITQAIQEAGAFSNVTESDLAQYVSETSKMFANQVLAEANKRGVLIDDVLKASDIKFANGKIQLNAGNETIAESPVYSTDVSAEIVMDKPRKALSEYKKDILSQKFEKKELETITRAHKNKFYKKQTGSLNNEIIKAERDFNSIINEIYSNPENINNQEYLEQQENRLNEIVKRLPDEQELTAPFYEKFYNAVNSAAEYSEAKGDDNLYQSAAMRKSHFDNFADFYKDVLSKPKNAKNKEQFNVQTKDGLNIRIPHDTIVHDNNRHKLSVNEWEDLLNNIDDVSYAAISKKKSRFDGTSVLLKIDTTNNSFGVVLETFPKNNPLISTAFIDTEQNIDNWIKNEAVPSGTKTTFLDISLNNIITSIHPNFKTKLINNLNQLTGMPKSEPIRRGAYNVSEKAIELFKDADYSTLPHEMAHFWLDNIWTYAKSGKASEAYMYNFKAIEDFLNIKPEQVYLTRGQQEKFARAYEKYLYNGYAPNAIIAGAFDDYDRWLKQVYNDAKELKVKLTPDAIEFFDSMTTGQLPEYTVEETQREVVQKEYPKAVKEAKEVVNGKQKEYNAAPVNNTTVPVVMEGEKRKSRVYAKNAEILGLADELDYNIASMEEQNKKAKAFVKEDLERAQRIVLGQEAAPKDILKNAIYNAYLKEMLSIGNNEAYIDALKNQSLELTRAGQEIASQRGAIENIFDSAYWIRRIEANLKAQTAVQKFGSLLDESGSNAVEKMNKFIKDRVDAVIPEFMGADSARQREIAEKLAKNIAAEFGKRPTELFQTMKEPSEIRTRTNAYNYLYRAVNEGLGISLTNEQANEVIAKTEALQKAIENTKDKNGNPSALFFKNMSAMEDYANSISPAPSLIVLTSIIGRGNMLMSPKSIALNIESNVLNFVTESIVKRIANNQSYLAVDPDVIKEYLNYSKDVYNASGYQVSTMQELDATRMILNEKMVTSQGEGNIRALGRFFEQTIFKYGMGYPDLVFKDMTFVDTVNLLATKKANGDSKKATEIFKDAVLIEPRTQTGRKIREIAINDALMATYQNKGMLSDVALKIRNAINQSSGQLRLGDLLSPFVKTPANVIGLGFDYTFGGLKTLYQARTILDDINRGQFTEATKKAIRSLGRNSIGVLLSVAIASLLDDDDYIPDYALLSRKERELVKLKNGVFNSVKIGDRYVSLDYFGPLAMPLVSVLNARRGADLKEQVFKYVQGSVVQAMKLPVVGDLKDLLDNTGKTLSADAQTNINALVDASIDFVSSRTIPAILSDIAKMTDDYERETNNSAWNRLILRIPAKRNELPAKYNYATGRPFGTENALSVLFAGARIKTETQSAVSREINRLYKKNTEETVGLSKVTKLGALSSLPENKKNKVEKEFAKAYATEVRALIETGKYDAMDDNDKVKAINKVRNKVRNDLKEKYGLSRKKRSK